MVVPQPFPVPARFFGVLLMLPGLKLGRDMVLAMLEIQRAHAWELSDLVIFAVWLGVVSLFVVPGWLLATVRRTVTFDRLAHNVAQVNDFLVYRWSSTRPLSDFTAVRVYIPRKSSTDSSNVTSVHVELEAARSGKDLIVFMDTDEDRARSVASQVVAATGLPLKDDVDATREVFDDVEE